MSVPPNFKKFIIQDQRIVLQKTTPDKLETPSILYDGLEDAKKVDLADLEKNLN